MTFSGITTFTSTGIIDFIEQLGPENAGLILSVENADPDSAFSQDEQDLLNDMIQTKVDGRFEYQLLRGISFICARTYVQGTKANLQRRPERARILRFRRLRLTRWN